VPSALDLEVDLLQRGKSGALSNRKNGEAAKLMLCQHGDCETLTLGHDFCAKHRHPANAQTAAQRHVDARGTQ
jgi:hypothetical protein